MTSRQEMKSNRLCASLLSMSARPGQNGPGSDAGSATNSPAMTGIKREDGPSAMQLSAAAGGHAAAAASGAPDDQSRDQDRLLPIANISRLMKRVLPEHAKMSKEAKAALQESVSEFIGFITSEASDRLVEEKRKTITGDDIIDSMRALGFDSYMEFLTSYLKKYRHSIKASKGGGGGGGGGGAGGGSVKGEAGAHKRGRKARGADDDDDEDDASHEADFDGASVGAASQAQTNPLTMQALLAHQLAQANAASGAGNTEADAAKKRKQ